MKKFLYSITTLVLIVIGYGYVHRTSNIDAPLVPSKPVNIPATPSPISPTPLRVSDPISNPKNRVTKKPFGIKISRTNSPVTPERFSGYHTGVDFETMDNEQSVDIPVYAICSGPLLVKRWASGYGGVAIQQCIVDGQIVTVVYGHLQLLSIASSVGGQLRSGVKIGTLGRGLSYETDGERKHLHLGIHKGPSIDMKGYVQKSSDLQQWINVSKYL